jgi:hypothetical protein
MDSAVALPILRDVLHKLIFLGNAMLKKILSVIGVIVTLIAILIVKSIANIAGRDLANNEYKSSTSKSTVQQIQGGLAEAADSINKITPKMIDEETRLDKAEVNSGLRFNYFYSSPNHSSLEYSSHEAQFQTDMKKKTKNKVCINKEMKNSLQLGVTYGYVYRGNDGVEITRFEINENDCNNSSP